MTQLSFLVDSPDVGTITVFIEDVKKPLWFGNYQTGKLAIYLGTIKGKSLSPTIPLMYVTTEQDVIECNFVGYRCYVPNDMKILIPDLMLDIDDVYKKALLDVKHTYQPTLH